jgi:RNA polymerase sigma factor (sigma-70 family)
MVSCSQRFDPTKGTFEKYLSSHLFNKAIDFLRTKNRKKRQCTFVGQEALDSVTYRQTDSDRYPSVEILPKLLSDSPLDSDRDKEDKLILLDHYLGGKSVVELSKKYNTTRVTIYNRIKKSIKAIREKNCLFAQNILGGSTA